MNILNLSHKGVYNRQDNANLGPSMVIYRQYVSSIDVCVFIYKLNNSKNLFSSEHMKVRFFIMKIQ